MIELPKPDKRYKLGKIIKDKNGKYRGNPETVDFKRLETGTWINDLVNLNPPYIISNEMSKFLKDRL